MIQSYNFYKFHTLQNVTILWCVDQLLGNDREISKYTTTVTK
jgi:hypothetical protein